MFVIISDRSRAVSRSAENLCSRSAENLCSRSAENLCLTCHEYRAVRYSLDNEEERTCLFNMNRPLRLRGPVSHCTDYRNKTQPAKYEMDKIAWVIEASRRKVGFGSEMDIKVIPPSERNDIEK